MSTLALPADRLHQFRHASADDPVLTELRKTWPTSKSDVMEALHPYYDFRDELTVQDQMVFKGPLVVIPAALRKEMMANCHDTHIGVEGCVRRARESMFWPRMTVELKEYISKCDVCMMHRTTPPKETILPHQFVARPWVKVGADLCELQGRNLLIVCDHFSSFIEVESLQMTTTRAVCKALKALFSRYGVPDILMTDNSPQFSSAEFAMFSKVWSFDHQTSSPRYPQSNGRMQSGPSSDSSPNVVSLGNPNLEHCWIGAICPRREWEQVPLSDIWGAGVKHFYLWRPLSWSLIIQQPMQPEHCKG